MVFHDDDGDHDDGGGGDGDHDGEIRRLSFMAVIQPPQKKIHRLRLSALVNTELKK